MQGKTVLITGAARRVGAAVARHLHQAGANVAVHYHRSVDEAQALVALCNAERAGSALALCADLLDVDRAPSLVEQVVATFGGLDALINNASTFYPTPIGQIDGPVWQDLVGTNLKAPLFLSQAAAPALREGGGSIINMIDIHAQRPLREHTVYCAAKAGLVMLTWSLARELGPQVRVNGISPGPILWPEAGIDAHTQRQIIDATALKRAGEPADIATTALYLLRDATYVTGQVIAVDGGRSIGW